MCFVNCLELHEGHVGALRLRVYRSYMVTLLNLTSIFEWYMTRLVVEKGQKKETCVHYDIGLCAQN